MRSSILSFSYCKSLLFKQSRVGIFNIDDKHYIDMTKECSCQVYSYGTSDEASLRCIDIEYLHNNDLIFLYKMILLLPFDLHHTDSFQHHDHNLLWL